MFLKNIFKIFTLILLVFQCWYGIKFDVHPKSLGRLIGPSLFFALCCICSGFFADRYADRFSSSTQSMYAEKYYKVLLEFFGFCGVLMITLVIMFAFK